MLFHPLDNRSLYHMYDFGMRALQPYSDLCMTLSKQGRRLADTLDLPLKIPFLSDMQNELIKRSLHGNVKYFRQLSAYLYVYHMVINIYEKPKFDILDV